MRLLHTFMPLLVGTGVLFIVLGVPLMLGRVPRNSWYGVRTPRTMRGTEAEWYSANRSGGKVMVALGSIMLGSALFMFLK
jgi:uncharacterized membrane protein